MIFSAANPLIWIAIGGLLLKLDAPITIDSNAGGTLHMYPATVLIDSSIDVKAITNITFYSLSTHSFYGIKASSKEVGFGWDAWYGYSSDSIILVLHYKFL